MTRERKKPRRGAYVAGTVGVAAIAVVAIVTLNGRHPARASAVSANTAAATSGSVGVSPAGAVSSAASSSSATSSALPPGPVNTDPDFTPSILGTTGSSYADLSKEYVPPYKYSLPATWRPATWYAQVSRKLGVPEQTSTYPVLASSDDSGDTSESWQVKIPGGSGELTITAVVLKTGQVRLLQCLAQDFNASSTAARSEVLTAMSLCADADFPGNSAAQAADWVNGQTSGLLSDLATMSAGQGVHDSTPVFGAGIYWLIGNMESTGATVNLTVYGSEP
jgi:hypothetical protein